MPGFRYPNKRLGARASNGRFARLTIEGVTGLSTAICPNAECRAIVSYPAFVERGAFVAPAKPPETCPRCGTALT